MSDEDRLAELLHEWEVRFKRGEDVPAAELCPDRPDLVEELTARIDLLRSVAWVDADPAPPEAPEPAAGHAPRPETTGDLLVGRYELQEVIGEGGHGRVWRGVDHHLQRPVAVKLPRPDYARRDPSGEDGFLAEARRVARLAGPGIVPVHDVGLHGGRYFIVSELIDGTDLGRHLRDGPVSVMEAARVVAGAARCLHHAHERGVVHRDVKPANILLGRDGRVYVTDFGIAVPTAAVSRAETGTGTLAYMAPERLDGVGRADVRGDVYGLGVVLYELLTGQLPYPGPTLALVREAIRNRVPVAPRVFRPWAIPPKVDAICMRCLDKDPGSRYPTAAAVADELGSWLADPDNPEHVPGGATTAGPTRPSGIVSLHTIVNRAIANYQRREYREAINDLSEAIRLDPSGADVIARRGFVYLQMNDVPGAVGDFSEAIRLDPQHTFALNNLGWLLATSPDERVRDGERAVRLATRACELTEWLSPILISTLAAAHAECGNFAEAVRRAREAIGLGLADRKDLMEIRKQLELYSTRKPYRK
jgi:serine/threonine protein kinase